MLESVFIVSFVAIICFYFAFFVVKKWDLMPLVLLLVLWFIPRQTVPGGILEKFLVLRWITVFVIPLIVVVQFVKMTIRSQPLKPTFIALPLSIYIIYCFCSGFINNTPFVEQLGSIVLYIRYPLLFIALANMNVKKSVVKRYIILFFILIALQVPECIYRYAVLGFHGDDISWSLGPWGAFDLGIYAIYGAAFVVAYDVIKGVRLSHMIFLVFLFLLSLLAEIKAFILSIPIISLCTIYATFRRRSIRKFFLAVSLPVFFIGAVYLTSNFWSRIHTGSGNSLAIYLEKIGYVVSDPTMLVESDKADQFSSRILGTAYIWSYLRGDWRMVLFGTGPGALLAGNFFETPGKIVEEVPYLNQIAIIVGETGIIGLLLFFLILLSLFKMIIKVNRIACDRNVLIISSALIGIWIFYALIGPFYDLVWRHDSPNFTFYFFAAFLYSYLQKWNNKSVCEMPSSKSIL